MKKGILIGGVVLILAALALFGGRKLFGGEGADTETTEAEVSDVSASDVETSEVSANDAEKEVSTNDAEKDVSANDAEKDVSANDAEKDVSANDVEEEAADSGMQDAVEEAAASSDENTLYTIKTSAGSNLGMVPIVNGNAVVLMDGGSGTTYQGEYVPEEQSAYRMKLEEQTSMAASEGAIKAWAFYRESAMKDFTFPEGVSVVEKFAFARSGLTGIAIPEGVTRIGSGAFYHCDSLTDVVIPDSVTVIEENAFSHTPWLENWLSERTGEISGGMETAEESDAEGDFLIVGDGILLAYRGVEENPELPPEVKSIAPGAFEY